MGQPGLKKRQGETKKTLKLGSGGWLVTLDRGRKNKKKLTVVNQTKRKTGTSQKKKTMILSRTHEFSLVFLSLPQFFAKSLLYLTLSIQLFSLGSKKKKQPNSCSTSILVPSDLKNYKRRVRKRRIWELRGEFRNFCNFCY